MTELEKFYKLDQERLKKYNNKRYIYKNSLNILYQAFESEAWFEFLNNKDIIACKNSFASCGKIDIEQCSLNRDLFGYKITSPINVLLSDNEDLIKSFSNIDYLVIKGSNRKSIAYSEYVKKGSDHLFIDTIIKTMNKELSGLSENLNIWEKKFLKLKKNELLKTDFEFFKGIIDMDKDLIFKTINILSTKYHRKRNKYLSFYQDFVSQPAMGYAKIAWLYGIELEFENELIHNELLPVKPNKNYTIKISEFKNKMTFESYDKNFNGTKLKEEEFNERYPKENNWLQQCVKKIANFKLK